MASVLDIIKHYQQAIEKYSEDESKVLRCIGKLFDLKVTVQHLQETGVGRTVNALRKEPGEVGQAARTLVLKWKMMVAAEESDQEGDPKNDTSSHNGQGSGRDSDDHSHQSRSSHDRYNRTKTSTPRLDHTVQHKDVNGHHSGSKRKYPSSEEENSDAKKKSRRPSSSEDNHKKQAIVKTEQLSDSESSDDDSESSDSDSDSYSSKSSQENVQVKKEIKQEIKKERKESPDRHRSSSSKHSHSNDDDRKRESSSSRKPESDQHSRHKTSSKDVPRQTSESSSKSSSHKHKSSHEKENKTEIKQKSDTLSDEKKESKSSSKHSSDKHKSSSHSSSERHKSSSDKYSSKEKAPEKHKSSSEKETSKHKSRESTKEKHSSSSKEKSKDRSSSSKERSSNSHSSDKRHSSSDSKSQNSDKSKHKSDDGSEKKSKEKSSSSSHKSKSKEDVPKKKSKLSNSEESGEDGIDCGSGASFAEALGMISPTKGKKKSQIKDVNSPNNSYNNDLTPAALLAPSAKLAPLPSLEISALPEISPNYKPRPPPPKLLPHFSDDDAISAGISSKNQRTKVYSGNKVIGKVTTLYEMCVHVLQEHIDALEYTGGVPYEILKPVVDRATPQQLFLLEHYNPYLMEDTDHLWQKFCERNFRNKKRQELESWREMFIRCQEEQEHRLKSLTANIRMTQEAKKAPIKQTKMAYVDSVVKPPRNIARKQAQHGTAHAAAASPAARVAALSAPAGVLRAGAARAPPAASVSASFKPKKAPLMQKALQFMRRKR